MIRVAIFASGSGSNAEEIMKRFQNNDQVEVSLILSNKKDALVHERAKKFGVPSVSFTRDEFRQEEGVLKTLKEQNTDLIVLAGFLWLIPEAFVKAFPERIINIHPALLPNYGGKGMYGMNVHQAVVENKETETGITIHYVNERYDEGEHILQASCEVLPTDTPEDVAQKIHALEYEHFPVVVEKIALNL